MRTNLQHLKRDTETVRLPRESSESQAMAQENRAENPFQRSPYSIE
jgi:hypothetical protein